MLGYFTDHPATKTKGLDEEFSRDVKYAGYEQFFKSLVSEIGEVKLTEPNVRQWIYNADPGLHRLVRYVMSEITRSKLIVGRDNQLASVAVLPMMAYPMYTKDQWVLNEELKLFLGKTNTCVFNAKYNALNWDRITKTQKKNCPLITRDFINQFEDLSFINKYRIMELSTQGKGRLSFVMARISSSETSIDLDWDTWNALPQMLRRMLLQTWVFTEQHETFILDPLDWDRVPPKIDYGNS